MIKSSMFVEKFEVNPDSTNGSWEAYGFTVSNYDGHRLPFGMISSFKVCKSGKIHPSITIEFSMQSASGDPDSSDHLNYTMPAIKTFARGKQVVDIYYSMVHDYIFAMDNVL